MKLFYDKKLFEKDEISRDMLEDLLILGHFFELQDLILLASDQVFWMIDNPRFLSFQPRGVKMT